LNCPGFWLGLSRASAKLSLQFEIITHGSEVPNRWVTHLQNFKDTVYDREYTTIFDRLPLDSVFSLGLLSHISQGFASEIDIIIAKKIHRTAIRTALEDLTYRTLYDIIIRKLQHLGPLPNSGPQRFRIWYTRKDKTPCDVTEDFPEDTDLGWREFYAGVFYVDLPEGWGTDMSAVAEDSQNTLNGTSCAPR
jgi:hypothetical protein